MISTPVLQAFKDEIVKLSSKPINLTKGQAALAATGLLGAGMFAEQAKDDFFSGRRARKEQAKMMGVSSWKT